MWGLIGTLFIGLLIIGLGVAISKYKCYWLIAGYNTSSKKEKENVEIEKLGKHMGRLCYLIAVSIWITGLLVSYFNISVTIPIIIITLIIFGYMVYMQKFDHNIDSKINKIIVLVIGIFTLLIMILVFSMGSAPNEVSKSPGKIVISGNYGVTLKDEDIKSVELIDTMPKILLRIGGHSDGKTKSGNFKLEGGIEAKLYIQSKEGPYIKITMDKYDVYINYEDKEMTKDIYKLIINDEK